MPWAVAIHGGAGLIRRKSLSAQREAGCVAALHDSLEVAAAVLRAGGTALDAVEAAVVVMEECPLFNAGRGAVLTHDGRAELDASVMCGRTLGAGAVTGVRRTRNPVRLARRVMEATPHVLLAGEATDALAAAEGLEQVEPEWFVVPERLEQLKKALVSDRFHLDHGGADHDVYGTVGAVACDSAGHLAAATSTGGMVNKRAGRVGDSPIVGAGTWASDATCAVSATGHGEALMRMAAAGRVAAWMEMGGLPLEEAARRVVHEDLPRIDGKGGLIAVDAAGRVALPFNTGGMFRGVLREGEGASVAIW